MHCFSGDAEQLGRTLQCGLHVSFAGNITYKSAAGSISLIRKVPEQKLLIETDCPYLSPQPHRGKRNEPRRIPIIAETVAQQRRLFPEDVGRITTFNLLSLVAPAEAAFEPVFVYRIRDSLYLNITNRCTCSCGFCVRNNRDGISGYNLRLTREPETEEILKGVAAEEGFREIVFCGFGEPTIRLDTVVAVARQLKTAGHLVRVNTNGLGSLYHGFDITERLKGIVDAFAVSLNAPDRDSYSRICEPQMGPRAFDGVLDFIRSALARNFRVTITTVEAPEVDVEGCRAIAQNLGTDFRTRYFSPHT
jgi:TatD DNase family protein